MGQIKDMTGQVVKNWEVIYLASAPKKQKSNLKWWHCRCIKCGKEKDFCGGEIRQGRIGECKCDKQKNLPKTNKISSHYFKNEITKSNKIKNELNHQYGKLTVIDFAYTKNTKAYWYCRCECGNECIVSGNALRNGDIKSCGCLVSYQESIIEKILLENHISFQKEYSFQDLYDKKLLRFDFAIYNQNNQITRFIEFDGRQHKYGPDNTHWSHSIDTLTTIQERDNIKNNFCLKHNYPLIRIPYTKLNTLTIDDLLGNKYLIKGDDYCD